MLLDQQWPSLYIQWALLGPRFTWLLRNIRHCGDFPPSWNSHLPWLLFSYLPPLTISSPLTAAPSTCFPALPYLKNESEVTQSCLTFCNPMDYSLPCSSVHGIFQPRVLEWVAIAFSMKDWLPSPKIKLSEEGKCGFPVWKSREYNPYDGKSSHCGIFRAPYTPSETKLKWWWDNRLQRFKTKSSNSVLVVSTKHQYFNYQKSEDQTQSSGELTGIRGDLAQPYLPVHPWKSSTPTHQAVLSNWVFRNTQLFE